MNDWRETTLGEEIGFAYGKSLPAHARNPGRFSVFGSNGLVGTHAESCVEGPGIIVGRKGSVGEVAYSSNAFWPIDTTYYVVNRGGHNWRFLYHLLRHSDLTRLNSHSAVPGLNREDAYSIVVKFPTRNEQNKIADALDCIESSICLETEALNNAQEIKRAVMANLFTRGIRGETQKETEIGLIPESWTPAPVIQLGVVKGGKRMPKGVSLVCENTGRPYIRVTDFKNHGVREGGLLFVPRGYEGVIQRYRISSRDIYISIAGSIGLVGQVPENLDDANLTENAAKIVIKRNDVLPRYVMYALAGDACQDQIERATAKNAQPKLALTRIEQILVPFPPTYDEQQGIVAIIDAIEYKIALHRQKCAVLKELFQSLLHKLMTCEIRVNELDLSVLVHAPENSA